MLHYSRRIGTTKGEGMYQYRIEVLEKSDRAFVALLRMKANVIPCDIATGNIHGPNITRDILFNRYMKRITR